MKKVKKVVLFLLGLLFIAFIVLFTACFVFEDRLINQGKKIMSRSLGTEIDADLVDISPIKHFPYITFAAGGLVVNGVDQKELVEISNAELLFNPLSVFNEEIDFSKMLFSKGALFLQRDQGKWNFDFGTKSANSKKLNLEGISLSEIELNYLDNDNKVKAKIELSSFNGNIELGEAFKFNGEAFIADLKYKTAEDSIHLEDRTQLTLDFAIHQKEKEPTKLIGIGELKNGNADLEFSSDVERLTVNGNLSAELFNFFNLGYVFTDGQIEIEDFILKDALQKEPQIYGNLRFRNIDLSKGDKEISLNSKPVIIDNKRILADRIKIEIGDSEFDFGGSLTRKESNYDLVGKLSSDRISVDDLFTMMQDTSESKIGLTGNLDVEIDKLEYQKWKAKDITGSFILKNEELDFDLDLNSFKGKMEGKGSIDFKDSIAFQCSTTFKEIETEEILDDLDNLGQELISSDNLSGELSGHALINFYLRKDNAIDKNKSTALVALDFKKGQLSDFKMLESFSKHIDVDDLMNVKFDHLSNLLEWKGNVLTIPMMFINNNAANFTISGFHDDKNAFVYNLQVNASDILARKFGKKKSSARRKGWWNMYYVVEGDAEEFETKLDKERVKTNFRRSKLKKREIFNALLNEFGNTPVLQNLNDWNLNPDQ